MKKLLLTLAIAFCCFNTNAQTVTPTPACFNPPIAYTPPAGTYTTPSGDGIAAADFNKDGYMDLALGGCVGCTTNKLYIQFGDGTGHLSAPITYTVGSQLQEMTSADFNEDGNIDLAITDGGANGGPSVVWLMLGTGSGTFGTPTSFSVVAGPVGIIHADFNHDGSQDLAVANYYSVSAGYTNIISILLGTGTGSFGTAASYTTNATGVFKIATADFNNDNNLDLAVTIIGANDFGQTISILKGTGTGSFGAATSITVGSSSATGDAPWGISTGYFNNDLNADIAVANFGTREVSVLLGTGTGTFGSQTNFGAGIEGTNPEVLICADLNLDGITDMAVGTDWITLFHGIGNGSFTNYDTIYAQSAATAVVLAADFNNDGKPDLATGNSKILLNCSSIHCSPITYNNSKTMCSGNTLVVGTHTYTSSGTYTDSLQSKLGCDSIIITTLTVPVVTTAVSYSICKGASIHLTATGTTNYAWSVGSTTISTTYSVSVTPSVTTIYTVSGSNPGGCAGSMATTTVVVNPVPTITVNNANINTCAGATTTLSVSGAVSYTWTNPATGMNTGSSIIISPVSAITYSVIGQNSYGCASNTAIVAINIPVSVKINNPTITTICAGSSATLSATWATSFNWSTGSTATSISVSPSITTIYTVTGIGPGPTNCTSTATATVMVNPTYTINNTQSTCGGSYALNGHTYTVTGTYHDTLHTVLGCDSIVVTQLTVNSVPSASVNVTQTSCGICNGTATITASGGTPPYQYTWPAGIQPAVVSNLCAGTYTCIINDINSCTDAVVAVINSSSSSGLNATYTLSADPTPHIWDAYPGISGGFTPYTYLWTWGDGTTDNTLYASHTYTEAAHYNVCLTVTDNNGCSSTYCQNDSLYRTSTNTMVQINVIGMTTGIQQSASSKYQLTVYPNPATQSISLSLSEGKETVIAYIYDVLGNVVLQHSYTPSEGKAETIDISSLESDMYYVRIGDSTVKFIKQ